MDRLGRRAVERLERRVVLSGTLQTTLLADGTLDVFGSPAADTIRVYKAPDTNTDLVVQFVGSHSERIALASITGIAIAAGAGNDSVTVTGLSFPCSIFGGDGSDVLYGGTEADTFFPGYGNDTVTGGGGFDQASYLLDARQTGITFTANAVRAVAEVDTFQGVQKLIGTSMADNGTIADATGFLVLELDGGDDGVNLLATGGNFKIDTGDGNDGVRLAIAGKTNTDHVTIAGGSGNDGVVLDALAPNLPAFLDFAGGDDRDILDVSALGGANTVAASFDDLPNDRLQNGRPATDNLHADVEGVYTFGIGALSYPNGNLVIRGTAGPDAVALNDTPGAASIVVTLNGRSPDHFPKAPVRAIGIRVYAGDDRVGMTAGDLPATIIGDGGNDTLVGGHEADFFVPGFGNDDVNGNVNGGVNGGAGGYDQASYDSAGQISPGVGDPTPRRTGIVFYANKVLTPATAEADTFHNVTKLICTQLNDTGDLSGDAPTGGGFKDVDLGFGDDRFTGSNLGNRVQGDLGNDTIHALGGDDTILPGFGNDSVDGGDGADRAVYLNDNRSNGITFTSTQVTSAFGEVDSFGAVETLVGTDAADTGALSEAGVFRHYELNGGDDNVTLKSPSGDFAIDGGAGKDNVHLAIAAQNNSATLAFSGGANDDLIDIPKGTESYLPAHLDYAGGTDNANLGPPRDLGDLLSLQRMVGRNNSAAVTYDDVANDRLANNRAATDNIHSDVELTVADNITAQLDPQGQLVVRGTFTGFSPTLSGNDTIHVTGGSDIAVTYGSEIDRFPTASVKSFVMSGNTGDDDLEISGLEIPSTLLGGRGDGNVLDGNDTLVGGLESDVLVPGPGNDVVRGGGGGYDQVTYAGFIDFPIDHIGFDANTVKGYDKSGKQIETDTFQDITKLICTDGNDTGDVSAGNGFKDFDLGGGNDSLIGSDGANRIDGEGGDDTIRALGGDDIILPGDGRDSVDAGDGADVIFNRGDGDTVDGGAGIDEARDPTPVDSQPGDTFAPASSVEFLFDLVNRPIANAAVFSRKATTSKQAKAFANANVGGAVKSDTLKLPLIKNGVLSVPGSTGNDNITVSQTGDMVTIKVGNQTKSMLASSMPNGIAIDGGLGNDVINLGGNTSAFTMNATITGGAGNDVLTGGGGNDSIDGGDGNDILAGGMGNDTLRGAAGDDTFQAGAVADGADVFDGGVGLDTAQYAYRSRSLTITVGDSAASASGNDGESNEHDNVFGNVEDIFGGSGNDYIAAPPVSPKPTSVGWILNGDAGNDTLIGSSGGDTLAAACTAGKTTEVDYVNGNGAAPKGNPDFFDLKDGRADFYTGGVAASNDKTSPSTVFADPGKVDAPLKKNDFQVRISH